MRRVAGGLSCLVLVAGLPLACGTSAGYDNGGNGGEPCKDVVEGYPCRPYGQDIHDRVTNLTFYHPTTGAAVRLSDYLVDKTSERADKVFIITSFAEWCGVCHAEAPQIYSVYKDLRDRGAELLMTVNQDSNRSEKVADIIAAAGRWEDDALGGVQLDEHFVGVLADTDRFLNVFYDVSATPMNMIVGSDFKIYYKFTGWEGENKFRNMVEGIIENSLESGD